MEPTTAWCFSQINGSEGLWSHDSLSAVKDSCHSNTHGSCCYRSAGHTYSSCDLLMTRILKYMKLFCVFLWLSHVTLILPHVMFQNRKSECQNTWRLRSWCKVKEDVVWTVEMKLMISLIMNSCISYFSYKLSWLKPKTFTLLSAHTDCQKQAR